MAVNVEEKVYLGGMLRLSILMSILFFSLVANSQVAGHYWTALPEDYPYCGLHVSHHLDLNADNTYRASWGICLIHHAEYGTYTVNNDTIFFTKLENRCSENDLPYEADSTMFHLNDQNIFVAETVKVIKYPEPHSCEPLGAKVLFYYNHNLYDRKFAADPLHVSHKPTYTSQQAEKRMYQDLERNATMLLVKQEFGIY